MNRCIIFDLDGTLIDSVADIVLATNRMRHSFHQPPLPEQTVIRYVGHGIAHLAKLAVSDAPQIPPDKAKEELLRAYREHPVVRTVLYPGVEDGLRILKTAGFRLAVASNKPFELCMPILSKLGAADAFDAIIGGEKAIRMKPEPDMLQYALRETNSDPAQSWMVGDSDPDIRAGKAAGCKTAYAAYGFGSPEENSWDFKADSFLDFVWHALKS